MATASGRPWRSAQREFVGEALVEPAPVGEARERVLVGLPLELVEQHRLLQVGLGQRDVERVELAHSRCVSTSCRSRCSSASRLRGGDLVLDRERAQLVARRLRLHLALELVEARGSGAAPSPDRRCARRSRPAPRGIRTSVSLMFVPLADRERRVQPLARLVVARLRRAQPAERQAARARRPSR